MQKREKHLAFRIIFVMVTILSHQSLNADPSMQIKGGDLESHLQLLNQWETRPDYVNDMYTKIYTVLAENETSSYADIAENAELQTIFQDRNIYHLGGPMLGAVTPNGIRIWLRTTKPAQVKVIVKIDGNEKVFGPVQSTKDGDLSVVVPVAGLQPSTSYSYKVLVDNHQIPVNDNALITTAPDSSTTGKVRIAFGSCPHRWGLGNHELWERIVSRNPAAMLIYGDIAVQDKKQHIGLHRADYQLRDWQTAWQGFAASIPVYATWDDHDYISNDKAGIPDKYTEDDRWNIRTVWTQAWNNPMYGFDDERGGIFLKTRIGPVDIIMVDNRYFRKNVEGSFLEEEQLQWLEQQLLNCKGPFIMLTCGTMWSDNVRNGKDSWGAWDPEGRERIFSFIEKNNIKGVLLLSGDRHGAKVLRIPRLDWNGFYEFEPASLGARGAGGITDHSLVLYKIGKIFAFGEFTFDATLEDPEVTFQLIESDGKSLFDLTLKRSQLTPNHSVQSRIMPQMGMKKDRGVISRRVTPHAIHILKPGRDGHKIYTTSGKLVPEKSNKK